MVDEPDPFSLDEDTDSDEHFIVESDKAPAWLNDFINKMAAALMVILVISAGVLAFCGCYWVFQQVIG